MSSSTLKTLTIVAGLALPAAAFANQPVESIDVTVDLSAVQNAAAAEEWRSIDVDLEQAIASKIVDLISEDGATVTIDIDAVSLANTYDAWMGAGQAELVGLVDIQTPGPLNNDRYELSVFVDQSNSVAPITLSEAEQNVEAGLFYDAMIERFAENVVGKLRD